LIVTNAHVVPDNLIVENLEQITIFFREDNVDKIIPAKEVARDRDHDIAILKISDEKIPPLKLGSSHSVQEGKFMAFTGFPMGMVLGLYPVTHRGMISAITPNVIPMIKAQHLSSKLLRRLDEPYPVFQLDATAYPGNSGSPLFDPETAEVVGIINKVFVQESKENVLSKPSGITYAIPVNHVQNLLKEKNLD
jgi:serine protease Do